MCAIIGYVCRSGEPDIDMLIRVFQESKIRGMHAFGYAFHQAGLLTVRRSLNLKEIEAHLLEDRPSAVIGHCRYSTSGDYRNMLNNQPIERDGRAVVVNGVIDMGTKPEMERRYDVNMNTENDAELSLFWDNPASAVGNISGSFAGLFLNSPTEILAVRNVRRPAYIVQEQNFGLVASTVDILRRSGIQQTAWVLPVGSPVLL